MSDQNPLIKLVKKSVGLPTGESNCCGVVAPPISPETANQSAGAQPTNSSSCCDSQGTEATAACDCDGDCSHEVTQKEMNDDKQKQTEKEG